MTAAYSRYKVLGVYPRRNAKSTLSFLERVVEEMPFPIQRIQIRIEQAIPKRRAVINTIWSPNPTTGRMTYDISADDSAHKREKWGVGCNPGEVSLSEVELTAPRLWIRMTRP